MRKSLLSYILLLILLLPLLPARGQKSDFKPMKGATEGYLPCGIKYYTLSTPWIKGKYALGMVVSTGNLYETREEVGIAHFLEHLCSTSVPGFDRQRSLEMVHQGGLNLFNDWQAFTSDTRTVYNYTYPKENRDTEEGTVQYLRGVLSDMKFTQKEVDIERPVILKEVETSNTSTLSNLSGGYFEHHSTLGDSAQICAITPEKLTGFYRKWYRPENIALVMIGDATEKELEAKLLKAFDGAHCVVDSVMAPAFLPINQSNVNLYSSIENRSKKDIGIRLIYRFPLLDMTRKENFRRAISEEMVGRILKGILEGKTEAENRFSSSMVISSNMPRASVVNISMECKDTVEFRRKLERVGMVISYLRRGEVSEEFLQRLWKERPSAYKSLVKTPHSGNSRTILANIYGNFSAHVPLTDPQEYAVALNEAAAQITEEDIRRAAETIFMGSRSFLAGFPDYGKEYQTRMVDFFDACCARPAVQMEAQMPSNARIASKLGDKKQLLRNDRPEYRPEKVKTELLSNGMTRYRLPNGMELIWHKTDERNRLLVYTDGGFAGMNPDEQEFMSLFKEIRTPQVPGYVQDPARGPSGIGIGIEKYRITMDSEWEKRNEEYTWQYLASIYTATGMDSSTYKRELKKSGKPAQLSLNEVNERINRMLVPAQTRIYLQGEADIELALAYLCEVPAKKRLKMPKEKVKVVTESVVNRPGKLKGNTFLVNRMCTEPVKSITLKNYLIHGMLEEYMSRMLLIVIRNENGLIYTWGTTPYYSMMPEPNTSLSLRFRIIPELLDRSLEELDRLCRRVAVEGVNDYKLEGLKRREWNRYLDFINEPAEVMPFVAKQITWCGKVWEEQEIRQCLAKITLQEVNEYFKHYLSLPFEVTIR